MATWKRRALWEERGALWCCEVPVATAREARLGLGALRAAQSQTPQTWM